MKRLFRSVLVVAALLPCRAADLFRDDFSGFPPGWLTLPVGITHPAVQAYHYLPHRGVPLGEWENAVCHSDAWAVGDEGGKPYLEQMKLNENSRIVPTFDTSNPIFLTGQPEWVDYTVQARVKPLNLTDMVGVVFRYHTNMHYYVFVLTGGQNARLALRLPIEKAYRQGDWRELASVEFPYDSKRYYTLKVENDGPRMTAYIDGVKVLEASDPEILAGRAGVTANVPARFQDFQVTVSETRKQQIEANIRRRNAELTALRAANPQPRLWQKFSVAGFGAGLNVRFGDLDGDGKLDLLIAQTFPRISESVGQQITCLTAVTLDGKVLWQLGRPDKRNGLTGTDLPFQIHDIDGDGRNEVVMVKDFKLQVLDGRSGALKMCDWMPKAPPGRAGPYELEAGDSIAFVNVSGNPSRREILVKDRYSHFWVFDNQLKLLWDRPGRTGHYPYITDLDGDGYDEIAIGMTLWDHTGRQVWSRDRDYREHTDGVVVGNFSGDQRQPWRMYIAQSDEGFLMFDRNGTELKHTRHGHNQGFTVGKYRSDLPGLQLMTVTYWRHPGIMTLFDWDGNILQQEQPIYTGTSMLPVNWRGDGQELILLSGSHREGGMIDGRFRRVVMFPDDGHPELACTVADVTGDARDEIILWDMEQVWIYTQDRPFTGNRIYAPIRNPYYNSSRFLTTVSHPRWLTH